MLGEFDNNDYILEKMHRNSIEYVWESPFWERKYLQFIVLLYILPKLSFKKKKFHKIGILGIEMRTVALIWQAWR